MKHSTYRIIGQALTDTSQAPRGEGIFYRCEDCGDIVTSIPKDNIRCSCRNIVIDIEYVCLMIRDFSVFTVLEKQ